jgi:hypothetical protein
MRGIDPGIDDGDQNLPAGGNAVGLGKMKLARRV